MKHYQRYLCALLCCVLLFPVFSINASAANTEFKDLKITDKITVINSWGTYTSDPYTFYSNDDNSVTKEYVPERGIIKGYTSVTVNHTYTVELTDGSPIIKKGKEGVVTLYNAYISQFVQNSSGAISPPLQYFNQIDSARALVFYSDGNMQYIDFESIEQPSYKHNNFTFKINASADVVKIEYLTSSTFTNPTPVTEFVSVHAFMGENSTAKASISLEVVTEEVSLLKGVIEWLKGIKQGITDLFDSVKNGFTNMLSKLQETLDNIKQLPNKIWTLIENGLKNLFVPSEDYIIGFKEDMNTLLEDRLGAVYEVANITLDSWDSIKEYDNKNTVSMPEVTISLPQGNEFTFGGYEVLIVPNEFQSVAAFIKWGMGIICTLAFINGLRKRYDEIMGVE